MKKMTLVGVVSALVLIGFVSMSVYADVNQPNQPQQIGVLDKIKKAYNDFKNKDKKEEPAKPKEVQPVPPKAELTKEEMVSGIKYAIETHNSILSTIPGIKMEKDKENKMVLMYNDVNLEDMSKENLTPLFHRVRQLAVRLRTERIQRQLETVKRAQAINSGAGSGRTMAIPPRTPPQIPQTFSIPKVPQGPSTPPSIPKVPALPPTPPRRQ